eukprot:224642-Prorocentrum_minimum.AAC.3
MPIDLSCLADPLLNKLANVTSEHTLEQVREYQAGYEKKAYTADQQQANSSARQLLVSKLYRIKLEKMVAKFQASALLKHSSRARNAGTPIISWQKRTTRHPRPPGCSPERRQEGGVTIQGVTIWGCRARA